MLLDPLTCFAAIKSGISLVERGIKAQVVGYDQTAAADHRTHCGGDSQSHVLFRKKTKQNRSPTDEKSGRVEVGDGWSALNIHPPKQAKGVDEQYDQGKIVGAIAVKQNRSSGLPIGSGLGV